MIITDFGIAVVEGDSHLSKWILEQRRLDVQDMYCQMFSKYIPRGGTVADVGACLGDHTLSYSRMVGKEGIVHAFEPHPDAYECLEHNFLGLSENVVLYKMALARWWGTARLTRSLIEPGNLGAHRVIQTNAGSILTAPLDAIARNWRALHFLKIDVEGMEPDVIGGAMETIWRHRPVLLVEVSRPLLRVNGYQSTDVFNPLRALGYTFQPSEPHHSMEMDQLDVLAMP